MRVEGHELSELRDLAETTATVAAAFDAGVFRSLAAGAGTPAQVAARAGLDERAVAILLPVLEEWDLLERQGDSFALTAEAHRSLADPESDDFEGGGLPLWLEGLRGFTRLAEVLASGEPVAAEGGGAETEEAQAEAERESLARFMAGMAATPRDRVRRVVDACLDRVTDPRTALDLGGGPGHMARAFVERGLEVTLFDRPETVDFVAQAYGLSGVEGLELAGGDFTEEALPEGPFDVVLVSNILHIYSPAENRSLLDKVAGATAPAGVVGVAEFFRGTSRRAVRFALLMLLRTDEGNTYTVDEVSGWLDAAGFRAPETVQVDDDRHLITALRVR